MTSQLLHAKIRGVADDALRNLSAGLGLKCWFDTASPRLSGTDATSTSEASSMSKAPLLHTGSKVEQQYLTCHVEILRRPRASRQFKLAHQIENKMECLHGKAVVSLESLCDNICFHSALDIFKNTGSCMGTKPDGCRRQRRHTGSECLQARLDGVQQARCATASGTA